MAEAALQACGSVLVGYDIPGRDCAQYSAGRCTLPRRPTKPGSSGLAKGIGTGRAVVILEPDALGQPAVELRAATVVVSVHRRRADHRAPVRGLGASRHDPGVGVYLDATHSGGSAWATPHRLVEAGVQRAQGYFVNVSNYQATPQLTKYGTWISDCIAYANDPEETAARPLQLVRQPVLPR